MFSNHFKVSFRQLTRNKTFSFINVVGLVTGITVCLFVGQFVWYERSFEKFNVNADRTYRVNLYNTSNGVFTEISSGTVSGLAYEMNQSVPGIELIARLSSNVKGIVSSNDNQIENLENEIVYADPSITGIFGLNLIEGDNLKILRDPRSIVISESAARKYFGNINVLGKVLEIGFPGSNIEIKPFQIQGVFNNIPGNSHKHFDFILPPENEKAWNENWAWSDVSTYVRLHKNIDPQSLNDGLAKIVRQHHKDNTGDRYLLEPLTEIRLHALDGSGRNGVVNFFTILGGVVILLAWLNYVSLSTARFFERMKEVGIRKLIGASRVQLILQLLMESFLFNFISFLCALLIFVISWPSIGNYFHMPISETFLHEAWAFALFLIFIFIGTLFSGLYPSLFLSSFKPLQSIKGKFNAFADRSTLRKVLVVFQLSISMILIAAIFAIEGQIKFMRNQNLGISVDQTLIVEEPLLTDATTMQKYETFKSELLQLPTVSGVTYASSFPGSEIDWHRTDITLGEENASYRYSSRIIGIGTEFLRFFDLTLITGGNFSPNKEGNNRTMLINEEASKMFGFKNFDDALNKFIFIGKRRFEIIGVIKNYHFRSLQYQLQPLLYIQGYPRNPSYAIKIGTENISGTISTIETKWKEAYPGNVFRYYFLDDRFERQYSSEKQIGTVVTGLTFLAIVISCLGLFGLSLYSVSRRTKEIGIRKVLGASISNVVILLSSDFFKLVLISGVIGVPFIYQGVNWWLEGYAYQMPIDITVFILPIVMVALLTLLTLSFQTMTAARANPVDSIKHE